jgi:hypothetical protein
VFLLIKLFFLKEKFGYFFHGRETAVISHGTTKRKRVPPSEIDKAQERRRKFLQDPARHTQEIEL